MDASFDQLRDLPVADKLRIVEQLWDDIHESDEPLLLQDWHEQEARRRSTELQVDPSIALTREELWRRVDDTNG